MALLSIQHKTSTTGAREQGSGAVGQQGGKGESDHSNMLHAIIDKCFEYINIDIRTRIAGMKDYSGRESTNQNQRGRKDENI